jgi:hypothetical protein
MLDQPLKAFVRGYQLKDKMLIIVLNDEKQPNVLSIQSDLGLWLPPANSYEVKYYDAGGNLVGTTSVEHSRWVGTSERLDPEQLAFFEIQAK